ncbi:MAG TPA: hypothetical protein VGR62_26275 [Candidatus Binatia bacterium]|jgi:hypothetical protein|nr:hypothetical protein [Candidatus Binatia bacterium]
MLPSMAPKPRYTTLFDALREIQVCTDTARRELHAVGKPDDPAFHTLEAILSQLDDAMNEAVLVFGRLDPR